MPSSPSLRLSIIIPTKDRAEILPQLLESIARAEGVEKLRPEVIVADNNSSDKTHEVVASRIKDFPTDLRVLKISRPGKSAAINDAVRTATGDALAFLDDDVTVHETWLRAVAGFFRDGEDPAGQGSIRLQPPDGDDPEIIKLVQRYRTIPRLEHRADVKKVLSLNGANCFVLREAFERVGGFDERLGPGASGTSEDVDFARRLTRAQIAIGYAPQAIAYHRVDRERLTEEYFKASHRRQGASRFLIRKRGVAGMVFNLVRAVAQYGCYTAIGRERERYRSKGRIYHYLGMMEARQNHVERRQPGRTKTAVGRPSLRP